MSKLEDNFVTRKTNGFIPADILESDNYYPTRLEYFAGHAMQGLCSGKADRQLESVARKAVTLAQEMERELDSAQD